jgi:uncharacterized protein (DUF2252 family)
MPSTRRTSHGNAGSREQRLALGRTHRKRLSRVQLGELHPRKNGFDPLAILENLEGRVPALLPLKYSRMQTSPFAFFRGSVCIMAADLARQPHSGLIVQLCGDAHVQNLGSFEAPDGRLAFDINDFDETILGPWEWDVKRMAASIVLAGSEANHRRSSCSSAVEAFANSYCTSIETLAEQPILDAARHQIHRAKKALAVSAALRQAQRADPRELLEKYTEKAANGRVQFKKIEHVIWRVHGQRRQEVLASLPLYAESLQPDRLHLFGFFKPVDVAFKVVGTGSVGLRDYVVLMDGNGPEDPLFLQIKQEMPSAYAPYLQGHAFLNQGQRAAEGQRKIQPASDLLLGWTKIGEHDYLVRHLNDHKGSVDLENLKGEGLTSLAGVAGELLARGHARSGDALTIKGYVGTPDKLLKSIVHFALEYAAQAQSDFELFKKAVEDQRVKVAA